jgi:hypothetical protein
MVEKHYKTETNDLQAGIAEIDRPLVTDSIHVD